EDARGLLQRRPGRLIEIARFDAEFVDLSAAQPMNSIGADFGGSIDQTRVHAHFNHVIAQYAVDDIRARRWPGGGLVAQGPNESDRMHAELRSRGHLSYRCAEHRIHTRRGAM